MARNRHVLADTLVSEHSATNIVVFDSQRLNINKWRPNIHQLPYDHSQKDYHIQALFHVEQITMDFGPLGWKIENSEQIHLGNGIT